MAHTRQPRRSRLRARKPRGAFRVLVRGGDGRLQAERFTDAAAYRSRLASLERSDAAGISIDELAGWLDTLPDR